MRHWQQIKTGPKATDRRMERPVGAFCRAVF